MSFSRIRIIMIVAVSIISFIIGALAGVYFFNRNNPKTNSEITISPPVSAPLIKGPTTPPATNGPTTPPPTE